MSSLPVPVSEALGRLRAAGFEAWLVGGCVRDRLMGKTPGDYDLCTSALPEHTKAVFAGERVIETGLKHGTVTVLLSGLPLEITTYRIDGGYTDVRHPDAVRFTPSLEEDLARRDFTVNAMAEDGAGNLRDPFGGREDLKRGVIRCVGDPDTRFREDALRILRALRFASVLGFAIEERTAAALVRNRALLARVSAERVQSELVKLLCGPGAGRVLLEWTEVLGEFLPELLPMRGFLQHNPHHRYDVLGHTAHVVDLSPPLPVPRLAALLHDSGKPACFTLDAAGVGHFYGHPAESAAIAEAVLRRLRFDDATRERVVTLVAKHDLPIEPTDRAVKRVLRALGVEAFFQLLDLKRADNGGKGVKCGDVLAYFDRLEAIAREALRREDCFTRARLAVNGRDLLSVGCQPGKAVGDALEALLNAVIDGRLPNEKTALLDYYRNYLHENGGAL